jgi:hypothetical protein
MTLVLIEMCHICNRITICYDHICDECVKEMDYDIQEE